MNSAFRSVVGTTSSSVSRRSVSILNGQPVHSFSSRSFAHRASLSSLRPSPQCSFSSLSSKPTFLSFQCPMTQTQPLSLLRSSNSQFSHPVQPRRFFASSAHDHHHDPYAKEYGIQVHPPKKSQEVVAYFIGQFKTESYFDY